MTMQVHRRSIIAIFITAIPAGLLLLMFSSGTLLSYNPIGVIVNSTIYDFNRVNKLQPTPPVTSPDAPVNVIIVTQMRSGSSFTGEIFNRNDDFIYYFEPLYELRQRIAGKRKANDTALEKFLRQPLKNLLQCNFQDMPITWWPRRTGRRKSKTPRQDCLYSKAFQAWPSFCKFNEISLRYRPHKHVSNNVTKLAEMCNSKLHVAVKTIRVEDISFLRDIVEDPTLNVKIIHLVRDPRGVYLSRKLVTQYMDKPPRSVSDSCPRLLRNLKYWLDTPEWLQNRYMLVRYEDLADRPVQITNDVYRFLGIKMPDSVRTWIKQNTDHDEGNSFSRTRNSYSTSIKWRTQLNINEVWFVQSRCLNVMQLLGYKEVLTFNGLRDLTYPVLLPLPSKPNQGLDFV